MVIICDILIDMIKNDMIKNRKGNIDVIRIFAMCLVLLCHSIEMSIFDAQHSELIHNIGVCLHTLSRLGVPIFLILTGYLLLPRTWDKKGISNFYKKKFNWLNNIFSNFNHH